MQEIGLFEAIYTQRAIRHFRPDPVPDELLHRVLEAATKAPSGSNRQPWAFVVIRDKEIKRRVCHYYNLAARAGAGERPAAPAAPRRRQPSGPTWSDDVDQVPVLIMACYQVEVGDPPPRPGQRPRPVYARYASLYPAVQNLLLAARGLGLGAVITTYHTRYDKEVKEVLKIPENVEACCLIPLGYPAEGAGYGLTRRRPIEEVVYYDTWGKGRSG